MHCTILWTDTYDVRVINDTSRPYHGLHLRILFDHFAFMVYNYIRTANVIATRTTTGS
jgi:hypothetical protein